MAGGGSEIGFFNAFALERVHQGSPLQQTLYHSVEKSNGLEIYGISTLYIIRTRDNVLVIPNGGNMYRVLRLAMM